MSDPIDPANNSSVSQADYLKLFMQELTYQDPLKPVDNKEFMAQMAQFSNLQVAQKSNDLLSGLLGMTSANQAINLIGKEIRIKNSNETGHVSKIIFSQDQPPRLVVAMKGSTVDDVILDDVTEVLSGESYL